MKDLLDQAIVTYASMNLEIYQIFIGAAEARQIALDIAEYATIPIVDVKGDESWEYCGISVEKVDAESGIIFKVEKRKG